MKHDRLLRALDDFIADYETEHGEITEDEMAAAMRRARERAISSEAVPVAESPDAWALERNRCRGCLPGQGRGRHSHLRPRRPPGPGASR